MTPHNKIPLGSQAASGRCSFALTATLVMEDNVFQSILFDTDMKKKIDPCLPCLDFTLVPPNWDLQERQAAEKQSGRTQQFSIYISVTVVVVCIGILFCRMKENIIYLFIVFLLFAHILCCCQNYYTSALIGTDSTEHHKLIFGNKSLNSFFCALFHPFRKIKYKILPFFFFFSFFFNFVLFSFTPIHFNVTFGISGKC